MTNDQIGLCPELPTDLYSSNFLGNLIAGDRSMPAVRFCSQCGEQLRSNRTAFLPLRAFCRNCTPRFRTARLILLAAAAACTVIGFAIGHLTTTRERFLYIGTPVESSRMKSSPDKYGDHSTRSSDSVTQREQLVISSSAAEGICGARTKSGKPCQRKVKGGGYCWQHRDKVPRSQSNVDR